MRGDQPASHGWSARTYWRTTRRTPGEVALLELRVGFPVERVGYSSTNLRIKRPRGSSLPKTSNRWQVTQIHRFYRASERHSPSKN
jgi:hypothetical protein